MLSTARALARLGVLGLNQRNADFISIYNQRDRYPQVDDKLQTKTLAKNAGIQVPELYSLVQIPAQLRTIHQRLSGYDSFVLKPTKGSGGEGIVVLAVEAEGRYRKSNGAAYDAEELEHHVCNILGGMYSLGGHPDAAMFEYRVKFDPIFQNITFRGVPDIRIIVFLGVPVMAMLRLPTKQSDGKANLHQGAVGAGIKLDSGTTCAAVWHNKSVRTHPETEASVIGVQIPGWRKLLRIAASCYELSGLGLIGVDIVLDKDLGPMLLELNARPGLNVQIANQAGLVPRLRLVEKAPRLGSVDARVEFAQRSFTRV